MESSISVCSFSYALSLVSVLVFSTLFLYVLVNVDFIFGNIVSAKSPFKELLLTILSFIMVNLVIVSILMGIRQLLYLLLGEFGASFFGFAFPSLWLVIFMLVLRG